MIQKEILIKLSTKFPRFFDISQSVLSILILRRAGVKVKGLGLIKGFSIDKNRIVITIFGKNSIIGKNVKIQSPLTMEDNVLISQGCKITGKNVKIGKGTNLMPNIEIAGPVTIGRFCAIARNSIFQGHNHYSKYASIQNGFHSDLFGEKLPNVNKGGISVGNDVWIGTRAIILPGVKIGDGAIIGAGSIVTKNVEPYSISAGIPAKHKKWRFSENIRKQLLEIKWWNWEDEKIIKNRTFFRTNLTSVENVFDLIKY